MKLIKDWSDFEVNLAVTKLECASQSITYHPQRFDSIFEELAYDDVTLTTERGTMQTVNQCSVPNDSYEILRREGIIVDYNGSAMVVIDENYEHITMHQNPLRAAMEVYLKIKGFK
jgi:hypothetical protein